MNTHFALGGDLPVYRLGFGAMRLCGQPGNFGRYADWEGGVRLLRRAVESRFLLRPWRHSAIRSRARPPCEICLMWIRVMRLIRPRLLTRPVIRRSSTDGFPGRRRAAVDGKLCNR